MGITTQMPFRNSSTKDGSIDLNSSFVFLNGVRAGESLHLDESKPQLTIGRDHACDIMVDDAAASRVHAKLTFESGSWCLEDSESRNGTQVNSRMVHRCLLAAGDMVKIGEQMLVYCGELSTANVQINPLDLVDETRVRRRIAGVEKHRLANEALAADSTTGPARKLAQLYHFSRDLIRLENEQQLIHRTIEAIKEGVAADVVKVCLRGPDGRLVPRLDARPAYVDVDASQFLSNWVTEKDEALLLDLDDLDGHGSSIEAVNGNAIGAPIPGLPKAIGVIECFQPTKPTGFNTADLEFVLALSQQFALALESIERREQMQLANEQLRAQLANDSSKLIGESDVLQKLITQVGRAAVSDATVLVLGESGTGKELIAERIHETSSRSSGPYVTVNCAAIHDGLLESELFGHEKGAFTGADSRREGQFERAHRGTIFLDEVGEMSLSCQAKLLRVLENRTLQRVGGAEEVRIDVRIVAATHRNLKQMVAKGEFREDLWYRLCVIELQNPPLRDRGDDVVLLASYFVERFRKEMGLPPVHLSEEAVQALKSHRWPGNVRELKNAVERAMVLGAGGEITAFDLGLARSEAQVTEPGEMHSLAEAERRHIENVLNSVGQNKAKACRVLGITRATLYNKLNRMDNRA